MENEEYSIEIMEALNNKLVYLELGSFEFQNDRIKEYLYKIESEIQKSNKKREELLKEYKKLKINIKSLADITGISRQTIYNNKKVLESYINDAINKQEKVDIVNQIKELNEKIQELEETIFKMQVRDLKIEKLQNKIDEQESTIIVKDKNIEALEKRNIELNNKINELERNIRDNKILKFSKTK